MKHAAHQIAHDPLRDVAEAARRPVRKRPLVVGLLQVALVDQDSHECRDRGICQVAAGGRKLLPEQVEIIREWIASGAATAQPEPEDPGNSAGITAEERAFWSFQPIRSPEIPKTRPEDRVRTPVDAFLAAGLAKRGLTFSEDADRITLLRRASFDLTGLPPSPEEVDAFLADRSPRSASVPHGPGRHQR